MAEQPSRTKLALMIIGFIVAVIGIGYLLFITFFRAPTAPVTPTPTEISDQVPAGIGLPTAEEAEIRDFEQEASDTVLPESARLKVQQDLAQVADIPNQVTDVARGGFTRSDQLTQTEVRQTTLSGDGDGLFLYNPNNSKFQRLDEFGNIRDISDRQFFDVENMNWSPQKDEGIIEYPDGSNILYNFDTDEQVTLPKHWEKFSFSPKGDNISFLSITNNPENNWLATSKPDGSSPQLIEPLGERAKFVNVDWSPSNQIIGMVREPIALERQEVYFIGRNDENFKLTVVEGYGLRSQWSPTGEKLLYSVANSDDNFKPRLWMVNASGEKIGTQRMKLPVFTFADRCDFNKDGDKIYCAEPTVAPDYSGYLPITLKMQGRDLNGEESDVPSMIVRIDVKTGTKEILAIPDELTDITQVHINDNEDTLFYTDEFTGLVRKIKL